MILTGYPNLAGEFLHRNREKYPQLSAHRTSDDSVEIWGPDGAEFPTPSEVLAWSNHRQEETSEAEVVERPVNTLKVEGLALLRELEEKSTEGPLQAIVSLLKKLFDEMPD